VVNQQMAMRAAAAVHLSGHGGTNDGIIGAAAAVGLTASGWAGRFIAFGNLRRCPEMMPVGRLRRLGVSVVSVDRDAGIPAPSDQVVTNRWLRPRLLGNRPVLLARAEGPGRWRNIDHKRRPGSKYPHIKRQTA
jgi:hypothetical protein